MSVRRRVWPAGHREIRSNGLLSLAGALRALRLQGKSLSIAVAAIGLLWCAGGAEAGWPFSFSRDDDCGCRRADCSTNTNGTCRDCNCDDDDDDDDDGKLKRCFRCLRPGEPPRGETAFALPARVRNEFAAVDDDDDDESDRESASASTEGQIENLERDLTRLTLIVEKLVETQKRDGEDLTRLTIAVEEIARAQARGQQDLTRISTILDNLALEPKPRNDDG